MQWEHPRGLYPAGALKPRGYFPFENSLATLVLNILIIYPQKMSKNQYNV